MKKVPFLSTFFSESGEEAKERFENIKTANKKKRGIIIGGVVVVAMIGVSLFIALNPNNSIGIIVSADGPTSIIVKENDLLDKKVAAAILANNEGRYASGECVAEGHIILGSEEKEQETIVYVLTMYGEYGFEDNHFVKVSGSGTIPAVIRFTTNDQGAVLSTIDWPMDGAGYIKSIKEMFPEKYLDRVLSISDEDSKALKEQEVKYARDYLMKIGREAEIGEYRDFEHILLTEAGVSVEISNQLVEKDYANYPFWIGNQEKIEDGVRYVYEMSYDKDKSQIKLTKYHYETKEVVEKIEINSVTGESSVRVHPVQEN